MLINEEYIKITLEEQNGFGAGRLHMNNRLGTKTHVIFIGLKKAKKLQNLQKNSIET